jgi:hypothetical protein
VPALFEETCHEFLVHCVVFCHQDAEACPGVCGGGELIPCNQGTGAFFFTEKS